MSNVEPTKSNVEMVDMPPKALAKGEGEAKMAASPEPENQAVQTTVSSRWLALQNREAKGCHGRDDNAGRFLMLLEGQIRSEGNENVNLLDLREALRELHESTRHALLKDMFPGLNALALAQATKYIGKDMVSQIGCLEKIPVINVFYMALAKSIDTSAESVLSAIDQIGILSTLLYGGAAAWAAGADHGGYTEVLDRFGRTANSTDGAEFYNLCNFGGQKEFSDVIESSGWWLIRNFNTATTMGISCTIMVALLAVLARALASVTGYDQDSKNDPDNKMYVMALKLNLIVMTCLMLTALYYSIVAERFWRMMTMPNFALEKKVLRCDDPFGISAGLFGDLGQVWATRDINYWAHYWGYSGLFVFVGLAFFVISLGIGISLKTLNVARGKEK